MKLAVLIAFVFISFEALAAEYYQSVVNFDAKYPEDSTVMMCDDTYLDGIEILIPGEVKFPESRITLQDCSSDWRITKKMQTTVKGKPYTLIRFKGGDYCTFEVGGKNKTDVRVKWILSVSDAC